MIAGLFILILGLSLVLFLQVLRPSASMPNAPVSVEEEVSSGDVFLLMTTVSERGIDLEWVLEHIKSVSPEYTSYQLKRKWGSIIRVQDAMIFLRLHDILEALDQSARTRLLAEQVAWQEYADAESDKSGGEYSGGTFASVAACARYSELAEERLAVLSSRLDLRIDF